MMLDAHNVNITILKTMNGYIITLPKFYNFDDMGYEPEEAPRLGAVAVRMKRPKMTHPPMMDNVFIFTELKDALEFIEEFYTKEGEE